MRDTLAGELADFVGPVEMDETFIGGLERNEHRHKWRNKRGGFVGSSAGNEVVIGAKDHATHRVAAKRGPARDAENALIAYCENVEWGCSIYTDESRIYIEVANR